MDDTNFRNPAELTEQVREKLPKRPKRVMRHHRALPYADAPQFMVDISARIPGERMNMNQDHVVLLSDPALAILDKMRDGVQGEMIFPNPNREVFSENAMLAVFDRLGYDYVTVHGFRSTFATWAEDCTDHPDGVREATLVHR